MVPPRGLGVKARSKVTSSEINQPSLQILTGHCIPHQHLVKVLHIIRRLHHRPNPHIMLDHHQIRPRPWLIRWARGSLFPSSPWDGRCCVVLAWWNNTRQRWMVTTECLSVRPRYVQVPIILYSVDLSISVQWRLCRVFYYTHSLLEYFGRITFSASE